MIESGWAVITPEYLKDYSGEIETFLQTSLTPGERAELAAKIVGRFSASRENELRSSFSDWMRRALERRHLGQVEAGEKIGVRHTSVGRWLGGKTEMPLDRFRSFYLLFGGEDEADHPLIPVGDLNLRGYCVAVGYMRQILDAVREAGRSGKADIGLKKLFAGLDPDDLVPLGTMTFLWLNYYCSSFSVLAQVDARVYHKYSKWIMIRGIHDHFTLFEPDRAWGTLEAMNRELVVWGMPWLLTLRFLAEANGGVSQDYVSAGYPARFRRRKQ